jgi:hypothetical protein
MIPSASPAGFRLEHLPGILFITSVTTFVQSFLWVKVTFLVLFMLFALLRVGAKTFSTDRRLVIFYLCVALAGIVWSLIGMMKPDNYESGILDAFRLYSLWSLAFIVLFSFLRSEPSLGMFHVSMVLSGILISTINLVAFYDQMVGLGLFRDDVLEELDLEVGFHDGFTRISSQNIGSLFMIVPYLIAVHLRADSKTKVSPLSILSLILSLVLVVVSGRRALWLVVAFTPCTILLISALTKTKGLLRTGAAGFVKLYTIGVAGVLLVGILLTISIDELSREYGFVRHLESAFLDTDERMIQKDFLLNGFAESPMFGSGFGAFAGHLRNELRPWTYELIYHQMLFNLGVVGMGYLTLLYGSFLILVFRLLRRHPEGSATPFGLLVGFCSLLIGAISNPYLRSFDYLFLAGVLPYLSTFRRGFDESGSLATGAAVPVRFSVDPGPTSSNPLGDPKDRLGPGGGSAPAGQPIPD